MLFASFVAAKCGSKRPQLDLIETYDEEKGFTTLGQLTGHRAALVAALSARGMLAKGAVPLRRLYLEVF